MLDKFGSFIRKNEKKSESGKLDSEYLIQFIDDIINSLADVNGVDNIIKFANANDNLDHKFVVRYLLHLNNIDMEELNSEILNCKAHLKSENLILDVGEKRSISGLKEAILLQVYTSKYRRSKKVK